MVRDVRVVQKIERRRRKKLLMRLKGAPFRGRLGIDPPPINWRILGPSPVSHLEGSVFQCFMSNHGNNF